MRILLDTNVLTRIAHRKEPEYGKALGSVNSLRSAGHEPCLVPQNVYEFWVVATRPSDQNGLGMDVSEADAELNHFRTPLFHLLLDERGIFRHWRELVVQNDVKGKIGHDTRLVAAMKRHDITHLLTFNASDFKRFSDITVLTPDAVLSK